MGAKTFTTMVQMENFIQSACTKAVEMTCNMLLGKLQELIMSEFYNSYDNETYSRTYQFYESAMTKMLTDSVGMIFMDASAMDYPFSGVGWGWSGQQQLEAANIGSHGGWSTEESKQHRFWDSFENYCNKNAIKLLKQNLIAQGLKLTK